MTKLDKMWIIVLIFGLCLMWASAYAGNTSPWTSFIGDEHNLQMCQDAEDMLNLTKMQDMKLQGILDDPKSPNSVKQIVKAQQKGLWQLEEDIQYWINTSCTKA